MENMAGNAKRSVAEFLRDAIVASGKTYEQIAVELDYESAGVIKMIAAGMTKLPINKVKQMAAALAVDPAELCGLVLADYYPGLLEVIEEVFGGLTLSQGERRLIAAIRVQGKGAEPVVVDARDVVAVVMV